jgi:hypothetical protein
MRMERDALGERCPSVSSTGERERLNWFAGCSPAHRIPLRATLVQRLQHLPVHPGQPLRCGPISSRPTRMEVGTCAPIRGSRAPRFWGLINCHASRWENSTATPPPQLYADSWENIYNFAFIYFFPMCLKPAWTGVKINLWEHEESEHLKNKSNMWKRSSSSLRRY